MEKGCRLREAYPPSSRIQRCSSKGRHLTTQQGTALHHEHPQLVFVKRIANGFRKVCAKPRGERIIVFSA